MLATLLVITPSAGSKLMVIPCGNPEDKPITAFDFANPFDRLRLMVTLLLSPGLMERLGAERSTVNSVRGSTFSWATAKVVEMAAIRMVRIDFFIAVFFKDDNAK